MSLDNPFLHFTRNNNDPYDGVKFCLSPMVIHDNADTQYNIEHPESWSSLAIRIVARKYLRRAGVPSKIQKVPEDGVPEWLLRSIPAKGAKFGPETSFKQVFDRLAGAWAYWGWKGGYFDNEEVVRTFYNEMRYMLVRQMGAPNSPQFFNTGLHWAYGIDGEPTGCQFYVDPATDQMIASRSGYERPQPHACFIMSVEDKLVGEGGIQDLWHKEALMFKFGSGVGCNFSNIRAAGEPLSGGGTSSGVGSFLLVGDRSAGAIKSGGTTRRAAKMVVLDIDHPEIEWFINWKTKEENKVLCLVAGSKCMARHMQNIIDAYRTQNSTQNNQELEKRIHLARLDGMLPAYITRLVGLLEQNRHVDGIEVYDSHWEGEAYRTISGQNANNTVRVTNEFMSRIHTDKDFALRARTNPDSITKTVKAKDLWEAIAVNAWASADPGVQFHDTINEWHTCPAHGPIRASNPCSEYMFLDNTACNLAALSIVAFSDSEGRFVRADFEHAAMLFTFVLEISVHMAQFPSEKIARLSYDFRTLGLGYANIGAFLMRSGIPYDSDQGRSIAACITALLTGVAYRTSARIAAKLGAFPGFALNKPHMMRVIRNHARVIGARTDEYEGLTITPPPFTSSQPDEYDELLQHVRQVWSETEILGEKYGFRNAQVSVIAPTGTTGLVMDCDTTGCEPDFALVKYKTMLNGNFAKIINQSVPYALRKCGYTTGQIEEIQDYILGRKDLHNKTAPINATSLAEKGLSKKSIDKMQSSLQSACDLNAITKNLDPIDAERFQNVTDLFAHLGFLPEEITESSAFYFGRETIEGAPHIQEEHLPIFDCANTCGPYSTRSLRWAAHIKFMEAIQPFISGAISKTANMPSTSSIDDCASCYEMGWRSCLKAVALYRDGCKSQPLSTSQSTNISTLECLKNILEDVLYDLRSEQLSKSEIYDRLRDKSSQARKRALPARRFGFTQKVYIGGHKLLLRTGEYPDGSLGEIFIDTHKEGATFRSLMNAFAMLFSISLQHGVPLEELVETFFGTKFDPAGEVVGYETGPATSMLSLIVTILRDTYLKKSQNTKKRKIDTSAMGAGSFTCDDFEFNSVPRKKPKMDISSMDPCGAACSNCGVVGLMIKAGSCSVCRNCGDADGCSG